MDEGSRVLACVQRHSKGLGCRVLGVSGVLGYRCVRPDLGNFFMLFTSSNENWI